MLRLVMPPALTIAVDFVAWGVFHTATGYAAHRLDEGRLSRDGWLLRPRRVPDPRSSLLVGRRLGRRRLAAAVDPARDRLVPLVDVGALPSASARVRPPLRTVRCAHARPALGPVARS